MIAKTSAFTLIELLVVVTIMIVLMSISIVSFSSAGKSSRDAKRKSDMETIRQAMVMYKVQEGGYPVGAIAPVMSELVTEGMLTPPSPVDPKNTGSFIYTLTTSADTTFCFCAKMEGGSNGNQANTNCNGVWATTGQPLYCVKQP